MRLAGMLVLWLVLPGTASGGEGRQASTPRQDVPPSGVVKTGRIFRVEIEGLRRIPRETMKGKLRSRAGEWLHAETVKEDVRTLNRLGWFESVRAEVDEIPLQMTETSRARFHFVGFRRESEMGLVLRFVVEERPFLVGVEYRGSRKLRKEQVDAMLADRGIILKVASPAKREELWRVQRTIEKALAEIGHPKAKVRLCLVKVPTDAVKAVFEIDDGPRFKVSGVKFEGNAAVVQKRLRKAMTNVAPKAWFAGLRRKTVYTEERLKEDLERLRKLYRDQGYLEAEFGEPEVREVEKTIRRWLPWPGKRTESTFEIRIPVKEGTQYRIGRIAFEGDAFIGDGPHKKGVRTILEPLFEHAGIRSEQVQQSVPPHDKNTLPPGMSNPRAAQNGAVYSEEKLVAVKEGMQRTLDSAQERRRSRVEVEVLQKRGAGEGRVDLAIRVKTQPLCIVRRIEFSGHHRFQDAYYRRRIGLKEGELFDARKLNAALLRLSRSGFIRPLGPQDVEVRFDEQARIADIRVRFEELGRQRFSLTGGGTTLGSTMGIVYNVFNLLGAEEMLTAHLEGGPETWMTLVGITKDGLLGNHLSLSMNLFHNVVKPKIAGRPSSGRLFTSTSTGTGLTASSSLTTRDTVSLSYTLSSDHTKIHLDLPEILEELPSGDFVSRRNRRTLALGWTHEAEQARMESSAAVSGGLLGGDSKLVRSAVSMTQLARDPLSGGRNSWAVRGMVAGVSGYGGGDVPFDSRLFGGGELLRGFRTAEITPYAVNDAEGAKPSAIGGNLMAAANAEYRVPLAKRTEAVAFLDAGTSWIIPGWLGRSTANLLPGTNGALRASVGVEARWMIPGVEVPLRVYYAANPLRLAQEFLLPNGSNWRAPDRRTALGWGIGSLF